MCVITDLQTKLNSNKLLTNNRMRIESELRRWTSIGELVTFSRLIDDVSGCLHSVGRQAWSVCID